MRKNTPIPAEIVDKVVANSGIKEVGKASIREIKRLINDIEMPVARNLYVWKWVFQACRLAKLASMHKSRH